MLSMVAANSPNKRNRDRGGGTNKHCEVLMGEKVCVSVRGSKRWTKMRGMLLISTRGARGTKDGCEGLGGMGEMRVVQVAKGPTLGAIVSSGSLDGVKVRTLTPGHDAVLARQRHSKQEPVHTGAHVHARHVEVLGSLQVHGQVMGA